GVGAREISEHGRIVDFGERGDADGGVGVLPARLRPELVEKAHVGPLQRLDPMNRALGNGRFTFYCPDAAGPGAPADSHSAICSRDHPWSSFKCTIIAPSGSFLRQWPLAVACDAASAISGQRLTTSSRQWKSRSRLRGTT